MNLISDANIDTLQTHKKTNFGSPNRGLQSLSNEAIDFPVVEHLPYRTSHVVCGLYSLYLRVTFAVHASNKKELVVNSTEVIYGSILEPV